MVFIVSLFVVDPRKLPEFSRKLAKWVNAIRGGMHDVKMHMEGEFRGLMPKGDDDVTSLLRKMNADADSPKGDPQKDTITEKKGET